jgi:hypothetical protein
MMPQPTDLIERTSKRVAVAAAFFPGKALCLERSLVLTYCLRIQGVDARFRIGVQPLNFAAHAWVECDGVPISVDGEIVRKLVAFPETTL